jgi:type VI secretion system secreted protein VgrG
MTPSPVAPVPGRDPLCAPRAWTGDCNPRHGTMIQIQDFQFFAAALPRGSVLLREMKVHERISGIFEMELEVESSEDVDAVEGHLHDLIGNPACVRFTVDEEDPARAPTFWGVVSEVERRPIVKGHPIHRIVVVPRVWYGSLVRRNRIFADVSVPEIAEKLLTGLALRKGDDFELRLSGKYPKREYVVQYEESDLDFLCRLLEEEGIFFHFEHTDRGDKIVLGDSTSAFRDLPGHAAVVFSTSDTVGEENSLVRLSVKRHVKRGGVALSDHNWRAPQVPVLSIAQLGGAGLVSTHREHVKDADRGAWLASIRAQEIDCRRMTFTGHTGLRSLRTGDVLSLIEHPIDTFNQRYLVVELTHTVTQWHDTARNTESANIKYTNELVAIPASVPFRPARTSPVPRIEGLLYATIDGPDDGSSAPIDDQGRYKVLFPWDLDGTPGASRTRWIRCAQPLSGGNYGIHFPLHEGAEVVIAFVHGDPDRPLIVGAVPNAVTPSPVTRKNATQSIVRTSSGITLELEDDA